MKKIFILLCVTTLTLFANTISKDTLIGNWSYVKKIDMGEGVVFEFDTKGKYYPNNKSAAYSNIYVYLKTDMSIYNTDRVKFKQDRLIIASYLMVNTSKWKIENGKLIEEIEEIKIIKNKNINQIEIKNLPIDESVADMMVGVIKKSAEKEKTSITTFKSVEKNKLVIDSIDNEKIDLVLKRVNSK
jgi:hypothetical protein